MEKKQEFSSPEPWTQHPGTYLCLVGKIDASVLPHDEPTWKPVAVIPSAWELLLG